MSQASLAAVAALLSANAQQASLLNALADQITADDAASASSANSGGPVLTGATLTQAQIDKVASDAANAVRSDLAPFLSAVGIAPGDGSAGSQTIVGDDPQGLNLITQGVGQGATPPHDPTANVG